MVGDLFLFTTEREINRLSKEKRESVGKIGVVTYEGRKEYLIKFPNNPVPCIFSKMSPELTRIDLQ